SKAVFMISPVRLKIPLHCHLGDMVYLVQYAMKLAEGDPDKEYQIFTTHQSDEEMLKELVALFNTKLQYLEGSYHEGASLNLNWTDLDGINRMIYRKAANLPSKCRNTVTVQTSSRTHHTMAIGEDLFISQFLPRLPLSVINLGDVYLPGVENFGKATIREKLNLIATARVHLAPNSGTAHLALLTNTHVVVYDPSNYLTGPLEHYFRKTDQIDFTYDVERA